MADGYVDRYKYSSARIDVPVLLSRSILEWSDRHIPDAILYNDPDDPTFGREEEPHITVLYCLHTADVRLVQKALVGERAGEVKLGSMSLFTSNDEFDVLKIEVESKALHKLHKGLSGKLKATDAYPSYIPHVTLAYVKKGEADKFVGNDTFKGKSFISDELLFSSKNGTRTKIKLGAK